MLPGNATPLLPCLHSVWRVPCTALVAQSLSRGREALQSQCQPLIKSYCLFVNQSPKPSRSSDKQLLLDRSKGLKGSEETVLINWPLRKDANSPWHSRFARGWGTRRVLRSFQRSRLDISSAGDRLPEIRSSRSGHSCRPKFL